MSLRFVGSKLRRQRPRWSSASLSSAAFATLLVAFVSPLHAAGNISEEDVNFFEKEIRPILVQQCLDCHEGTIQAKGGLRLDNRLGIQIGGQRGELLFPGDPEKSLLIKAVKQVGNLKMPPGDKLTDEQIASLEEWVRRGAPDPREPPEEQPFAPRDIDWAKEGQHWSFLPVRDVPVPTVASDWSKTNVDRFVQARYDAAGIQPAGDADKATWLRRVYFDLVGLPPSVGELLDFELDVSPQAKERVVDRLLASPRFGERFGRHWLDVARYGESTGKERNFVYLQAWRYRDYVIDAFNADKPYNEFLVEQIAGDLLPHANLAEEDRHRIATGFLSLNPKGINDRNRESFLLEIVDEQLESVSRGVMGLTATCARCHDHKYDPISQNDYYALAGIFRSTEVRFGMQNRAQNINTPDLLLPVKSAEYLQGHRAPEALIAELKARTEALQLRTARVRDLRDALPPPPQLTPEQVAAAGVKDVVIDGVLTKVSTARDSIAKSPEELRVEALEEEIKAERRSIDALRAEIAAITQYTLMIAVKDREKAQDLAVRIRGEVDKAGVVVPRGFLTVVPLEGAALPDGESSGRLQLARWITDPRHPLTSRVFVNRLWSKLFGAGIVSTVDDFGTQGQAPTHPELLDFLAKRLVNSNWSTKSVLRELALSRVYGLEYAPALPQADKDIDNKLLWRANRKRLDAEVLRDAVLAAGGTLEFTRPSGSPLTELGTRELGVDADYTVLNRAYPFRSVYLPYLRGRPPEMLAVFDAADASLTVGKRDVTAGPDQALYLLNSPLTMNEARRLASRLLDAPVPDDLARVQLAFRITVGQVPQQAQIEAALATIRDFEVLNSSVAGTGTAVPDVRGAHHAAWANFVHTLFALPEFRYVF